MVAHFVRLILTFEVQINLYKDILTVSLLQKSFQVEKI